jgi:hypothetical protein
VYLCGIANGRLSCGHDWLKRNERSWTCVPLCSIRPFYKLMKPDQTVKDVPIFRMGSKSFWIEMQTELPELVFEFFRAFFYVTVIPEPFNFNLCHTFVQLPFKCLS